MKIIKTIKLIFTRNVFTLTFSLVLKVRDFKFGNCLFKLTLAYQIQGEMFDTIFKSHVIG